MPPSVRSNIESMKCILPVQRMGTRLATQKRLKNGREVAI